jgi:3-deoxy-D-manno-octulosonate 8-phosphate phosphatase (KDO 8-P phosphatase)
MSPTTPFRAAQLGVTLIQNGATNKVDAYDRIVAAEGLTDEAVAYMGDDVVDLGVLGRVGLSAAPADCVPEVRRRVDWVSGAPGGNGAARELIETVLKAQKRWESVVATYTNEK